MCMCMCVYCYCYCYFIWLSPFIPYRNLDEVFTYNHIFVICYFLFGGVLSSHPGT